MVSYYLLILFELLSRYYCGILYTLNKTSALSPTLDDVQHVKVSKYVAVIYDNKWYPESVLLLQFSLPGTFFNCLVQTRQLLSCLNGLETKTGVSDE